MRLVTVLLLLAALFCGSAVTAVAAPAQPAPTCSLSLGSDAAKASAQAQALGAKIKAHNARQGSVDTRNAGAVNAYNAEADALNAERDGLAPLVTAIAAKLKACGSSAPEPGLPDSNGDIKPSDRSTQSAPVQTKPGQSAPSQTAPVQTKPGQTAPAQTNPVQTKPVQSAPSQTGPVQTKPGQTAPAQTNPVQTKPTQTAPGATASSPKTDPKSSQGPPDRTSPSAKPSDAPTAVENAGAPVETKINDPEYLARNYENAGPGLLRRKSAPGTLDANGDVIPKISPDPAKPGAYRVAPDTPDVPASFTSREYVDGNPADVAAQKTVDQRAQAIASGDNGRITTDSEALGEAAGQQSIKRDFPADKYDVKELTSGPKKPGITGQFDQVFRIVPKDGGPERIVINETKAPYGKLGMRRGDGGKTYQQGTRGYVESLLETLAIGSQKNKAIAAAVGEALDDGLLTYRMVQARVPAGGKWSGYIVRNFGIG